MATDMYEEGREFARYVGAEVRAEAGRVRMSVAALARQMEIDRSQLIRYLDGKRAFPMEVLYVAAEVLDQDPGRIVELAYERFLLDHPEIDHRHFEDDSAIAEMIAPYTPRDGVRQLQPRDFTLAAKEAPGWREETDQ